VTVDRTAGLPLARPATAAVFALLVVPLVLGTVDGRLWTPLAAPGYLLMMVMTIVGSVVAPQYEFWLYWPPFVLLCYGLAVGAGAGYYRVRSD
jgi:hypothetical protein